MMRSWLRLALGLAILVIFAWIYAMPFAGRNLFRRVIATGGDHRFGFSVEAYRWHGEFQHLWADRGFCVKIRTANGYDRADFSFNYDNLAIAKFESGRLREGVLHLTLQALQFDDSEVTKGQYQLLFYRAGGSVRTCFTTDHGSIAAERNCDSLEREAKAGFEE